MPFFFKIKRFVWKVDFVKVGSLQILFPLGYDIL